MRIVIVACILSCVFQNVGGGSPNWSLLTPQPQIFFVFSPRSIDQMVMVIMVAAVVLLVFSMIELCNKMMIDTATSNIKGGDHITGHRLQGAAGGRGTVFHLPI